MSSLFSNFQLTLPMHPGKMYMPPSFPYLWMASVNIVKPSRTNSKSIIGLYLILNYQIAYSRRAVTGALIGRGECILIYSCSALLIYFQP